MSIRPFGPALLFLTLTCLAQEKPEPRSHFKLTCKNPAKCHDAVGALIHRNGVCTTYLIAPDIVATNRHCLSEGALEEGASCQGTEIRFPENAHFSKAESLECDKVLSLS